MDSTVTTFTSVYGKLVSLVHDHVSVSEQRHQADSTTTNYPTVGEKDEVEKTVADLFNLVDDPVATILSTLLPLTLESVFLAMGGVHVLSLRQGNRWDRNQLGSPLFFLSSSSHSPSTYYGFRNLFYQIFNGVFDDQFAAMDALLNGKESFALQVLYLFFPKMMHVDICAWLSSTCRFISNSSLTRKPLQEYV
ncbi:unnamed protein product [Ilex paraguariensis]|uniref:Uncharacterized protein n=1 Tax=Ilex paraguariensis TaxID=185542 RepID=A0ABC8RFL4_9AQUA